MSKLAQQVQIGSSRPAPAKVVQDVAAAAKAQWHAQLSSRQRKRIVALVRKSGGRPSKLSTRQRKELVHLVRAFDPLAFAKSAVASAKTPALPAKRRGLLRR